MPVLRPRNRLVYFRISDDEFTKLQQFCQIQGARSISDVARLAVERLMRDGSSRTEVSVLEQLQVIDGVIRDSNRTLQRLVKLLDGDNHAKELE